MISIVIPVWNGAKYLKEAIDSALNQTFEDKEVIVVDDGSTDNSLDIIKGFGDKIKWSSSNINSGTATALNYGIKLASGEWIKWLSADDVLYPDALQNMMSCVYDKNIIYFTDYDIIDDLGNKRGELLEPYRNLEQQKRDLKNYFFGNGSTSLIHKSVFEKCGLFDEEFKHSEDYEFWCRCLFKYGVELRAIPIKTLKYRIHPEQLTRKVGGSLNWEIQKKYC